MKSEACYYWLEGFRGYLSVAAHSFNRRETKEIQFSARPAVAALTFSVGTRFNSLDAVDTAIALSIGRYILGRISERLRRKQYIPNYKKSGGTVAQQESQTTGERI